MLNIVQEFRQMITELRHQRQRENMIAMSILALLTPTAVVVVGLLAC